jgi:hypothetical protein
LKLINLLKNFFFKKSILFNILKKIKLFNNILTLNFNLIYSAQSNSIFKNSKLLKLNKISLNNNLSVNQYINFLKNSSSIINKNNVNIFINIFNKKQLNQQIKFFNKNLTPEFVNFLKTNNLDNQLKTFETVYNNNKKNYLILNNNSYYSKINNFFKFLSYESSIKFKNFSKLNFNNKIQILNDKKIILNSFNKTLTNFANFKLQLTVEKNLILNVNILKILLISQFLNKNNDLIKSNFLNFKFYNESNKLYNSTLIINLKLKEILTLSLNDK